MMMISFFSIYEISFPAVCVFISHYNRIILLCEYSIPLSFKRLREAVLGLIDGSGKKSMIFLKHGPQGKAGRLKGVFGMVKTNVMRLLDAARIVYETGTYEVDENDLPAATPQTLWGWTTTGCIRPWC